MKRSLLDLVQSILNDLDCDEVNSIDDTIESQQVANTVRDTYFELIDGKVWPHLRKLITFDSLSDLTKPTYLKVPENIKEVVFFNYDKKKAASDTAVMKEVLYKYPDEFLRLTSQRNTTSNTTVVTDFSGTPVIVYNDRAPEYWTSFDDNYIVCDAYNHLLDDTLKASKTQVLAYTDPIWSHLDDAIPDLPSESFSLLLEEAKSTASFNIKQMVNQKAEQKAKRQRQWQSRRDWQLYGGVRYDNYGRKGRK